MKTFVILPARMKSSRLQNKLIKKIGEMTLIEHMIARAKKIKDAIIIVSTDSNIIYDYAVKHFCNRNVYVLEQNIIPNDKLLKLLDKLS